MLDIQKRTYLNLILSKTCSEEPFVAKSLTLDFLNGFDNPCTAIVYLNESLTEGNQYTRIGLNCAYGILLAVEEYRHFTPTIIIYKFLETLIDFAINKLDDITIKNYETCMAGIIKFIGQNINFRLISNFVKLGHTFIYSDMKNEKIKNIFKVYCETLKCSCEQLLKENRALLCYKIPSLTNTNTVDSEVCTSDEKRQVVDGINKILNSICTTNLLVLSNDEEKRDAWTNKLRKKYDCINVKAVQCCEVYDSLPSNNIKIIVLIDLKRNDYFEMLYLLGRLEGQTSENQLLACFYNTDNFNEYKEFKDLIGRYANEADFESRLNVLLKHV